MTCQNHTSRQRHKKLRFQLRCIWIQNLYSQPLSPKGDTTHAQKGSLWVKSQEIMPEHNESCSSQKPSLWYPSWLRDACTRRGVYQGRSGVEKETRELVNGKQRPRRNVLYKWLKCLFTALLLTRWEAHTLSLQLCISVLLLSHLNKLFLFVLSHLCYVFNNKLCTCIYSFCLCDTCIFHRGQRSREN